MSAFFEWLTTTAGIITAVSVITAAGIGVFKFMKSVGKALAYIQAELVPNGGGSLRDAINRIEALQLAGLQLTGKAYWLSNPAGECTFASVKLATLMGKTPDQILGWGWVSAVALDDREKCRKEWDAAVKDHREFHLKYSYVHEDGTKVGVVGHAIPVIHAQTKAIIGMIGWAEPSE